MQLAIQSVSRPAPTPLQAAFPQIGVLRTDLAKVDIGFSHRSRTGEIAIISAAARVDVGATTGSALVRSSATTLTDAIGAARQLAGRLGANQAQAVLQGADGSFWIGKLAYATPSWQGGEYTQGAARLDVSHRSGSVTSAFAYQVAKDSLVRAIVDASTAMVVRREGVFDRVREQ